MAVDKPFPLKIIRGNILTVNITNKFPAQYVRRCFEKEKRDQIKVKGIKSTEEVESEMPDAELNGALRISCSESRIKQILQEVRISTT
jgi:hypothetical protein